MSTCSSRPYWQRPSVIFAIVVICVGLIGVTTAVLAIGKPRTSVPAVSPLPVVSDGTPLGVQQDGSQDERDHTEAVMVRQAYPEYYPAACHTYPANAALKKSDLVPNANVIANIAYDSKQGKYTVTHDPRIAVKEVTHTEPANSDGPARTAQDLTFSFAAGVHYFKTFVWVVQSSGNSWNPGPLIYSPQSNKYALDLYPQFGSSQVQYLIVATDTTTCAAGSQALPVGFPWDDLAKDGTLVPDFYGQLVHPS